MSGIYCICNTLNNKVYVGKTSQPFKGRWAAHKCLLRMGNHANKYLQAAWLKYGESAFTFAILEAVPADQTLCMGQCEAYWAVTLQANNPEKGYNLAIVLPDGTPTVSEETRARQRAAHLGKKQSPEAIAKTAAAHRGMKRSLETCARISRANTGQAMSEQQRQALSASRRGKPLSDQCRAQMSATRKGKTPTRLTDLERADIVRRYGDGETRRDLAAEFGVQPNYISMLCTQDRLNKNKV